MVVQAFQIRSVNRKFHSASCQLVRRYFRHCRSFPAERSPIVVLTLWAYFSRCCLRPAQRRLVRPERKQTPENASLAYVERRRSRIRPEYQRLSPTGRDQRAMTELVSFRLHGAPSWYQIVDWRPTGKLPDKPHSISCGSRADFCTHRAASWKPLCRLRSTKQRAVETETLFAAAKLTSKAIETRRLYSDW